MSRLTSVLILGTCLISAAAAQGPLQTFTVRDYLQHEWTNELVHFPLSLPGALPENLQLTDAAGTALPCQVNDLTEQDGQVTGSLWTVLSVPPKGTVILSLHAGAPAPTDLRLEPRGEEYLLRNDFMTVRLPRLTAPLAQPVDLTAVPAPLLALARAGDDTWLGAGTWINAEPPLQVKTATTTVLEEGPVRVTVRYRLTFTDDRFYQADVMLGCRQDAVLFTEESDVETPQAAFRFSFQPGVRPDRLFWRNNYYADSYKGLTGTPFDFEQENTPCQLCPWTFWWQEDRTTWAGFYRDDAEPFLGVLAIRPSRWSPYDWNGYDRTLIPITARPGGQVDITLGLVAWTRPVGEGQTKLFPVHRELAFTVGDASDFLDKEKMAILAEADAAFRRQDNATWNRLLGEGMWLFKLRRQLLQYSEFPLDEVKDFGFDFTSAVRDRERPYLLFSQADFDRARRQAETNPALKAELAKSLEYMTRLNPDALLAKLDKEPDGWRAYFRENYVGNGMYECAPAAYVGSADPRWGPLLAAGVKGLATQVVDQFLNNPERATLGGNGHMAATTLLRLLLAYDAVADSGYLTPEDKADIEAALVFGGFVFDHPDYWNLEKGLCSANPNMTSLLKLPLGLVGLYLDGHPRAAHWLAYAEAELQTELNDWISPGGAWLECPFYQAPSLDGMFMLARALKNIKGRDYFAHPNFRATMDYYGFILTPPDVRFPTPVAGLPMPMTIPSIGDAFPYFTTPFNGWMARVTAEEDPEYSARQQFYWQGQAHSYINGGRANAFMAAICDPELPATAPTELSRAFEGFGNILRTSWTDPDASYVAHRCGYYTAHYDPGDPNSIIYFAKGAPLCMDFGHRGADAADVHTMWRPDYHTAVSFDRPSEPGYWGASVGSVEASRGGQEVRSLPQTLDYSAGISFGGGGQVDRRHLVLVKSADPQGATYVVMRDITADGQPNQAFTWNLWCLAEEPEIRGNVAHFPGQFGVDLDAHVLSPANPEFTKVKYGYEQWVWPWWGMGKLREDQTGVRVPKLGSTEDFLALLYPRAAGQGPAEVTTMGEGRGVAVRHLEGDDLVLLSPGRAAEIAAGEMRLTGETAFARRYLNGALRLAVLQGAEASAEIGAWGLHSDGPTAIHVDPTGVRGESSGAAHRVTLRVPAGYLVRAVTLDGRPAEVTRTEAGLALQLPEGYHSFRLERADG